MKKLAVVLAAAFVASLVLTGVSFAAEKFAYIDLSKAFSEYKKTKDYDKTLGDKEKIYTDARDKKINEIKQLQDKIALMNDKEKQAKQPDCEAKVNALKEYDRQQQTDLRKDQDEKMKEILKDIEDAVKAYAQQQGFIMVFNDRVLVYQDKTLDITDKIIGIVNKGYKK